jgi:glucosamine-6-phosphate deaminase
MKDIHKIPVEDLGIGSSIKVYRVETEEDLYYQVALELFDEIKKNNEARKKTALILPVGPIGPYRKLAWLINRYQLSLKNVTIFNMDEYLDENKQYIPKKHPLSFRGCMDREFYNRIPDKLNVPKKRRIFPKPGNEGFIWNRIQEIGGIDICMGGVGINGHIAFNEPPEPGDQMTTNEYVELKTRVLKLTRETRTINSVGSLKGCIELLPKWCITVGMKEILSARKIRLCMPREWNCGMVRQMLYGPVTCKVPCSLLQRHNDSAVYVTSVAAQLPAANLQVYNR